MGTEPAMKVGVLTSSISRKAGGLYWSVRSLAKGTKQAGREVQVFSKIDRFSAEDAAQWQDLDLQLFACRGPKAFGYLPGLSHALDEAGPDLIHTHGLWMYPSVAAWRWSKRWDRPLVVSPRGMLDPWAVRNSAVKKRLAGMFFENAHLRRAACLHALCESEYQSIRNYGLSNPVAIIPNGVNLPDLSHDQPEPAWANNLPTDSRVLLFLGRIHPKKGLINLLHGWAKVRQQISSTVSPWHLVIGGWDQGGHQEELKNLVNKLRLGNSVHFVGPLFDEQKRASLSYADGFILPSFSEGLPMAVLEAWSYCLPVLMTPQCNLSEGFEAQAALEMQPEAESIATVLTRFFNLTEEERTMIGKNGQTLAQEHFTWPIIADQMCAVYTWLLGQGPKPNCVVIN